MYIFVSQGNPKYEFKLYLYVLLSAQCHFVL